MTDYLDLLDASATTRAGDVGERQALTLPAFWSAVNWLASTIATLPRSVYRKAGDSREPAKYPSNRCLGLQANRNATAVVADEVWVAHAVVFGNGYQLLERDARGYVVGRHGLPPDKVEPVRVAGETYYRVDDLERDEQGRPRPGVVPASEMLHLRGLGFDDLKGYPVVRLMSEALSVGLYQQKHASKFAERGTMYGLSLEIPGEISPDKLAKMIASIRAWKANPEGIPVLHGGAKLAQNAITPDDAKLIESRAFSIDDVCRILRVPPHMVYNLGRATWGNAEQMGREVVQYSLASWLRKIEQEMTVKLLSEAEISRGLYVYCNTRALLRGDPKAEADTLLAKVSGGLMTQNEARALMELPPVPGGDVLRVAFTSPNDSGNAAAKNDATNQEANPAGGDAGNAGE